MSASSSESPGLSNRDYWNGIADLYQSETVISTRDFHYGPLLAGDREWHLLPGSLEGKRCIEFGCGAGQNSIYLARQGAVCVAVDISEQQIEHGRRLAEQEGVPVEFRVGDVDDDIPEAAATFDLVHSTYALPFAANPSRVITNWAALLKPGGVLLFTTSHPAYAGEWIELDDEEDGLLIKDYFRPSADVRTLEGAKVSCRSNVYPLSRVCDWVLDAGLIIRRMLEPEPLPVPVLSEEDIRDRIPYYSKAWADLYPVLSCVPVVAIFLGGKPE